MNTPRSGSLAKAWTDVRTPERTMKVPINEKPKARMASRMVQTFQRLALFYHDGGMQEGGPGNEPRHEGSVFNRIPEPETAPAKLIVGPPRPHGDADGQEYPRGQRPPGRTQRAHAASTRPSIKAAMAKLNDIEKANVAEIQERWVESETGVLQQKGFRSLPFKGGTSRRRNGLEVNSMKARKAHADQPLHR